MLPSSKSFLVKGGLAPSPAAFVMIGCFLGGVFGIQVLSKLLHRFIPSHVVDCHHTHREEEAKDNDESGDEESLVEDSDRPLLSRERSYEEHHSRRPQFSRAQTEVRLRTDAAMLVPLHGHEKQSIGKKLAQTMTSFISTSKNVCDESGPCFGYSKTCGNECYRVIISQDPTKIPTPQITTINGNTRPSTSTTRYQPKRYVSTPTGSSEPHIHSNRNSYGAIGRKTSSISSRTSDLSAHHHHLSNNEQDLHGSIHHHHVASNEFLSIGLQTSIAIALHKLPEGFITYATNHANPRLGISIFMALSIHNITEGFALALPLYLALNNRLKAMLWASLLGGASQPLGAGMAALWFKVAQSQDMTPSEEVYGVMFAITAGIMTNVALQLFAESLGLIHNKALCISMAFVGMGVLGLSNALTAS